MSNHWYIYIDQQQRGPFTWEQLRQEAHAGTIGPADLVWVEGMSSWTQAGQIPGLMSDLIDPLKTPKKNQFGKKKNRALLFGGIMLLVLLNISLVFFLTTGSFFPSLNMGSSISNTKIDVGEYYTKEPDPAFLIETDTWGTLPANQIAVMLADDLDESDAITIATSLGAAIVGKIELINFYQLETNGTSEEELEALLTAAMTIPGVAIAVPNSPVSSYAIIEGRSCSPLNDPMYDGNNSRSYEMIGLQNAWDIIRAAGLDLHPTRIGVNDNIIYTESGHEFSHELNLPDAQGRHSAGKVRTIPIDRSRDLTAIAVTREDGQLHTGGLGHGTAVTHVVAADHSGGTVGVAGMLGDNLEVLVNVRGAGKTTIETRDPEHPLYWTSYTYGTLEHMLEQVENGATVINLSWGVSNRGFQNAKLAGMTKMFLEKMHERYPNVIFVAAAGNSKGEVNGSNCYWGHRTPNLITVGALNHDGGRAEARDWYTREQLEEWYRQSLELGTIGADMTYDQYVDRLPIGSNYAAQGGEVTLSASGTDVPVGVGPDGKTLTANGTSFAAPQVTGAIALIRSINPELNAAQIKKILTDTASRQVERNGVINTVPENLGAGVLRVDAAVLQVINDMRAGPPDDPDYPKLPPLDRDYLLGLSQVKLTAELLPGGSQGSGQEWLVTASIREVGPGGTELEIRTSGQGMVSGSTKESLNTPGEVTWRITVMDEHFTVRVFRLDTMGCAVVELFDQVDINGSWSAVAIPTEESEEKVIYVSMMYTVDFDFMIQVDSDGQGSIFYHDFEGPLSYNSNTGVIEWSISFTQVNILHNLSFNGIVSLEEDSLTINGNFMNTYSGSGRNQYLKGTWQAQKNE